MSIFLETFIVEAVGHGDLAGFMIASDEGELVGVEDFEGEEVENGFY
jgi:hypothetical protein